MKSLCRAPHVLLASLIGACSAATEHYPHDGLPVQAVEAHPGFHVAHHETREIELLIRNATTSTVEFDAAATSCACLEIPDGQGTGTLAPGETFALPLRVRGSALGIRQEKLQVFVSGHDQGRELVDIPIEVWTGPRLYTVPEALQLSGSRNAQVATAFAVQVAIPPGSGVPELTWELVELPMDFTVEEVSIERGPRTDIASFVLAARLPDVAPGSYVTPARFRYAGPDGHDVIEKPVSLLIHE